jgi:3-oxoacyl-[acyl-carrier-protein] synthase III
MKKVARIAAIELHVPSHILTNEALHDEFPEWSVQRVYDKTGISKRHIVADGETASDLAFEAARKLFAHYDITPTEIDYIILCTQSPDYFLPTTACLLQNRLGIPVSAGAVDINQGCSGYIYGLGLAKGLLETDQAKNVLLLTAETYSKYLSKEDKSVRTLFGDAAAATLVTLGDVSEGGSFHSFVYGSDGAGAENLIVPKGAARGNGNSCLSMNGPEVLAFTLKRVPDLVDAILTKAQMQKSDVDLFVPHQANKFMIESLARKLGFPNERLLQEYQDFGNTVSSTIPIALKMGSDSGKIIRKQRLLLAGFGVGYSWGGCILDW